MACSWIKDTYEKSVRGDEGATKELEEVGAQLEGAYKKYGLTPYWEDPSQAQRS